MHEGVKATDTPAEPADVAAAEFAGTGPAPNGTGLAATRDLDLLVMGEINPDIVVAAVDPRPVFGQVERVVDAIRITIGSSSAIFAAGAARLGLRTGFFGTVGDDTFGRFMLTAMAERGIDVSACVVDAARPTGASVILAGPHDRAILTAVGTIDALDVDAIPDGLLQRARHVHVGSYFFQRTSRDRLPAFFRTAQEAGLTTSFDCNWDPDDAWDGGIDAMLPVTDVFFPNAAEATRIARLPDVVDAARELALRGTENRLPGRASLVVAVKRGAEGALVVAGDELLERPALPVVPVDTTGAGDSFDAGFLLGWLSGWPLTASLDLGVVCGSISTQVVGGTVGQPTLEEAQAVLAGWQR
jgi:sugar/nucleoside kinase (ribokinase family)